MLRKVLAVIIVCATLTALSSAAEDKPVYLFILSGQSNMAGMKPESGFLPEAKKLFADGEVLYVKVAVGGQPIRLWVNGWNDIAAKHDISARADKDKHGIYYKQILSEVATKLNGRTPKAVTFCWMQGERDAKESLEKAYAESLTKLIADLRRDLKCPDMYFVIGRISDYGKPGDKSWQAVREAQVGVANADPKGAWVDCDDLNNKTINGKEVDDLHYTQEGYKILGERYARQARTLIDGKKAATNGRP